MIWLTHMRGMTHSYVTHAYVCHGSFICVTRLIHMRDMTPSGSRAQRAVGCAAAWLCWVLGIPTSAG